MIKSSLSQYRVDNVPLILRPIFYLYGYGVAILLFIGCLILRKMIKVEISGLENLRKHANYIFCFWHTFVPLGLISSLPSIPRTFDRASHAWMQHPSWYMKAIHVVLRLMGVDKIILGSTGHSGREAADQLVDYLRGGYSTLLMPDGPDGPPYILKKGILHISMQSGIPIVAIQFSASKFFELKTWDRKKWPYPFSTVKMKITAPIQITSDNLNEAQKRITAALS
ncbi:MAG: DUF374 domain-containing protein [Deltaproteobacteria bacterium]|nr:MAG: DUF374 domain-containing protein [Deltaproteobacteria bacterium]